MKIRYKNKKSECSYEWGGVRCKKMQSVALCGSYLVQTRQQPQEKDAIHT